MREGFPCVVLVFARRHEQLVLQVFKLRRSLRVDQTILGTSAAEKGINVLAVRLVLDQNLLPSGEELQSSRL